MKFLCILILFLSSESFAQGIIWPMFGHDARHSGRTTLGGPVLGKLKWKKPSQSGAAISFSPVIGSDGTIYFAAGSNLYALRENGTIKWKYPAGVITPAIGPDGTIYAGKFSSFFSPEIHALTPTGVQKWLYRGPQTFGAPFKAPVIGPEGTIYVSCESFAGGGGGLFAVTRDGQLKWSIAEPRGYATSPAAVFKSIYVGLIVGTTGYVAAVRADGNVAWRYRLESTDVNSLPRISGAPVVKGNGNIYVGATNGIFYAFSPAGRVLWRFRIGSRIEQSAALSAAGTIYFGAGTSSFGANDYNFYALTPAGKLKWKYRVGTTRTSPAVDAAGNIYFVSDGSLYALTPAGRLKWKLNFPISSPPAIGRNRILYAGGANGYFYAIR